MRIPDRRYRSVIISLQQDSSTTINDLAAIWQRVLQRPVVGIEENFFEAGGGPRSAAQLFAEIEENFGAHFPPQVIYQFPTVGSLASFLERAADSSLERIALLKAGSRRPVFFINGLGGSVFEFFHLVKHIPGASALYGVHAKGFDGREKPPQSIEEMAQVQLEAIRALQPRGQYLLVGYSLGGLVSIEIARRLLESGEKVQLLAVLDAYPHRRCLRPWEQVKFVFRLLGRRAFGSRDRAAQEAQSEVTHRYPAKTSRRRAGNFLAAAQDRMRECATRALENYRPTFYPGEITFIRAAVPTEFPLDPAVVWTHLCAKLTIETTPGDHYSMLDEYCVSLGKKLGRYLKQAEDGRDGCPEDLG